MLTLMLLTGLAIAQPPETPDPGYGRELPEGAANLDFIVVNRTGQTITAVQITPEGDESWTRNVMVQRDLPDLERSAVSFTRDLEQCRWDVRVTFENGNRRSWPRVDLCETVRVELR
jgi:hypothetical protein